MEVINRLRDNIRRVYLGNPRAVDLVLARQGGITCAFDFLTSSTSQLDLAVGRYMTTHDRLVQAFAKSVIDGGPAPVTGEEGRESIRVLDMIVAELLKTSDVSVARP